MSQNRDEGKQTQQGRRGAGNSVVGRLALGFHAQMFTGMAKGGFHLPAALKENEDVKRVQARVGGQERLRVEFASHITDEDEADRHRRLPGMIPKRLVGTDFNIAQVVGVPDKKQAGPTGRLGIDKLFWGGEGLGLSTGTTKAEIGRGWFIQSGI